MRGLSSRGTEGILTRASSDKLQKTLPTSFRTDEAVWKRCLGFLGAGAVMIGIR